MRFLSADMAECALRKAIVHTFPSSGDADQNPYVFDVCCNSENLLAVSACGPGHVIKVYDQSELTCVAQLHGHSGKVNELHFSPTDPNGLYSASSDGTLRLWDMRVPSPNVHTFNTGGKEVWSASMSLDATYIAGGVASAVRSPILAASLVRVYCSKTLWLTFGRRRRLPTASLACLSTYCRCRTWDLRTRKAYRSYVDAHTDDVTCVRAHPLHHSVFVTGR